ncbi:MAG: ABC transporter substrate-binding protein [Deltaproteobacteria bacterium]|nr:ABC transporter substrate-binding protein [Deltaproteobacteria bacterium]
MKKRMVFWILVIGMVGLMSLGAAMAQDKAPLVIGAVQPLTGPVSIDGMSVVYGIKIAMERINAEGGVLGRPIQMAIEDGKGDPVESVNAVEKLIRRDKVPAIIGCWASSATLAAMPIVKRNQIPLLVETSTAPMITDQKNEWVFRFTSHNDVDGALMEQYLVPKLGFKKAAYLAVNNDWGRSMANAVTKMMEKTGGKVLFVEYASAAETNFTPMLTRIKSSEADTLFITTSIQSVAMILKQLRELGIKMNVFVTSASPAEKVIDIAGKEASEGVYFFNRYVAYAPPKGKEEENKRLVGAYQKIYPGKAPDMYVAFGYDALYIMADAIKRAGEPNAAKIREALESTDFFGLTGRVNKNGAPQIVYQLKD